MGDSFFPLWEHPSDGTLKAGGCSSLPGLWAAPRQRLHWWSLGRVPHLIFLARLLPTLVHCHQIWLLASPVSLMGGGAAGGAEKIYHLGWTPTGCFLALHTYTAHDLCILAACLFISQMGSKQYYLSLRHSQLSIGDNIHMPLFFLLWGNDRLHLLVIDFK